MIMYDLLCLGHVTPRHRSSVSNPIRTRLALNSSAGHTPFKSIVKDRSDQLFDSKPAGKVLDSQNSLITSLFKRVEEQSKVNVFLP